MSTGKLTIVLRNFRLTVPKLYTQDGNEYWCTLFIFSLNMSLILRVYYSWLIIIQQYPGQNILCVMICFLVFIICIFLASPPLCNDAYLCHMRKYFHYALRYQFSNLYIQKWCKVFFDLGIIKSINMLRLIFLNSLFYFIFRLCISNCLKVLPWSLLIY